MLSYGITALQLMPEESTAALVIITDGILDVPNLSAFERVMRQVRARIISCSFVQTGVSPSARKTQKSTIASLGHVPNEELLKFISLSTFGSFINFDIDSITGDSMLLDRLFCKNSKLFDKAKEINDFQHELLSWGKNRRRNFLISHFSLKSMLSFFFLSRFPQSCGRTSKFHLETNIDQFFLDRTIEKSNKVR